MTTGVGAGSAPVVKRDRLAWVWLALAMSLLGFASGSWAFAPAALLSPVFALRFARSQTAFRAYVLLAICSIVPIGLSWRVFPFGGSIGFAIFCVVASLLGNLPYFLDRLLGPASPWLRTLPLPLTAVTLETISGSGELGSWGATAYSLADILPVAQLASVTGLAGFAFAVGWIAALVNGAWESWPSSTSRWQLIALGVVAFVVIGGGELRLLAHPESRTTVTIAAIATPRLQPFGDDELRDRWRGGATLTEEDQIAIDTAQRARIDTLLQRSKEAAKRGAVLVTWSEGAAVVTTEQEAALVNRLRAFSRANELILAASILVLPTHGDSKWDNKVVLFDASGNVAWTYRKAHPTPGFETAHSQRGDGTMQVYEAPWGRIAGAICYDADFPDLIAQASKERVDLLVVPAGDWPAVASMHAKMARVRAIEQGLTIVRSAAAGLSTITNSTGKTIAQQTQRGEEVTLLIAEAPIGRVPTVYGRIGNVLGPLCGAGLSLWLLAAAMLRLVRRIRARFS